MNPEKFERRAFMLKQYVKSFCLKEAVELTAAKFGCKKPSLYTDWARRGNWIRKVCNFQDTDTLMRGLFISFYDILKDLNDFIKKTDNPNCKLGALKLLINTLFRMIELLKDLKEQERQEMHACMLMQTSNLKQTRNSLKSLRNTNSFSLTPSQAENLWNLFEKTVMKNRWIKWKPLITCMHVTY